MPETTPVPKFVQSLNTGMTDSTKALDKLFGNPQNRTPHPVSADPDFPRLQVGHALDTLQPWAQTRVRATLPSPVPNTTFALIVAHIDRWPEDQKENVRKAVVDAIISNRKVSFSWELHSGNKEKTVIKPRLQGNVVTGTGPITITFRSPRRKVRQVGPNDITVDV